MCDWICIIYLKCCLIDLFGKGGKIWYVNWIIVLLVVFFVVFIENKLEKRYSL